MQHKRTVYFIIFEDKGVEIHYFIKDKIFGYYKVNLNESTKELLYFKKVLYQNQTVRLSF